MKKNFASPDEQGSRRAGTGSADGDVLSSLILLGFLAMLWLDPTTTTRVQEYGCEGGAFTAEGACKGRLLPSGRLKFVVNRSTKDVALIVLDAQKQWYVQGTLMQGCTVVDGDNWECTNAYERIGMLDGEYARTGASAYGHRMAGLSGWRHWANYAAGVRLAPTWRH